MFMNHFSLQVITIVAGMKSTDINLIKKAQKHCLLWRHLNLLQEYSLNYSLFYSCYPKKDLRLVASKCKLDLF